MFRKLIALLLCICTLGSMTVYAVDDVTEPTVPETTQAAEATTPVEDPSTPAESTPAESTPAESTPAESTPAESTPAESTPVESTPVESTPTESTPEESFPEESFPEDEEEWMDEDAYYSGGYMADDDFSDFDAEEDAKTNVAEEAGEYIRPVAFTEAGPLLVQNPTLFMRTFAARATTVDKEEIKTSKSIQYNGGDSYTLKLESYLEGEPDTAVRTASNIVVVVDQSGSMDYCFACGEDNADDAKNRYAGLKLDNSVKYYVRTSADKTTGTRVYYCDGVDCKYTHAKSGSRTGGWFTKNHATASSGGTQYIPSVADGTITNSGANYNKVSGRIFYTDSALTTLSTASSRFHKSGVYYNSDKTTQYYFCKHHGYWHTSNSGYSSSTCTNTSVRVPYSDSSDSKSFYTVKFYAAYMTHTVTATNVKTSGATYYVNTSNRSGLSGYGDTYVQVKYCSICSKDTTANPNKYKIFHQATATHTTSTTTIPTKYRPYTSNSSVSGGISRRLFYSPCKQFAGTRYDALIESLNAFKEYIYEDSTTNKLTNRIAVVGYGDIDANTTDSSGAVTKFASNILLTWYKSGTTTDAADSKKSFISYAEATSSDANKKTYFSNALRRADNATYRKYIDRAINNLNDDGGNTQIYKGMEMARLIFTHNTLSTSNNKVVILFTDGYPNKGPGGSDKFDGADTALQHAKWLKDNGATVFTVGVFSGADATNKDVVTATTSEGSVNTEAEVNKFMQLLSSNYSSATTMKKAYSVSNQTGYYLTAGNTEELTESFLNIAQKITGGGSLTELTKATIVRDIMADGFALDTTKNATVYTQACNGQSDGAYTFSTSKVTDSNIKLTSNAETGKVEVTGFDFVANNVHYTVETDKTKTYKGKRLVIEIPIKKTSTIGGEAMVSNDSASGIYVGSTVFEHFKQPTADVPTSVTVTKQAVGMNIPDAQKFDFNITYSQFTNVKNTAYDNNNNPSNGNHLIAKPASKSVTATLGNDESWESAQDIIVGTTMTIQEVAPSAYSNDYKVEYSIDGGKTWKEVTKSGNNWQIQVEVDTEMEVIVRNTLQRANLVINKSITGAAAKPEQSFLFHVYRLPDTIIDDGSGEEPGDGEEEEESGDTGEDSGDTGEDTGGGSTGGNTGGDAGEDTGEDPGTTENPLENATFVMDVLIPGYEFNNKEGSVTIEDIPVGNYLVVEDDGWSWRYEVTNGGSKYISVAVTPEAGGAVNYTNEKKHIFWLSGDSWCENWWNGSKIDSIKFSDK